MNPTDDVADGVPTSLRPQQTPAAQNAKKPAVAAVGGTTAQPGERRLKTLKAIEISRIILGSGASGQVLLGFLDGKMLRRIVEGNMPATLGTLTPDVEGPLAMNQLKQLLLEFEQYRETRVAVKMISKNSLVKHMGFKALQLQLDEIEILKKLASEDNENIIRLYHAEVTNKTIKMVFEYCDKTFDAYLTHQLEVRSRQSGPKSRRLPPLLPEVEMRYWLQQIANAFKLLRKHNFVHRDFKPQNLLLRFRRSAQQQGEFGMTSSMADVAAKTAPYTDFILKLADFGFTKVLPDQMLADTLCGTRPWMAPEQFRGGYTSQCDIWSIGVVMLQMICGKNPFKQANKDDIPKAIHQFRLQDFLKQYDLSQQCINLLTRLLTREPSQRCSFDELFQHPFLVDTPAAASSSQELAVPVPIPESPLAASQQSLLAQNGTALLSASGRLQKLSRKPRSPIVIEKSEDGEEEIVVGSTDSAAQSTEGEEEDDELGWVPVDEFERARSCLPALEGNLTEEQVIKYRFTMTEPGNFIIFIHNLNQSWVTKEFDVAIRQTSNATANEQQLAGSVACWGPAFQHQHRGFFSARVVRSVEYPFTVIAEQLPMSVSISMQAQPVGMMGYVPFLGASTIPFKIEIVKLG